MPEDTIGEVKNEGDVLDIDKAFERLETKGATPSATPTEKKEPQEAKTPREVPKDNVAWARIRREAAEAKKAAADARAEIEALKQGQTTSEPPKWWIDRYGNTEDARKQYQAVVQKDGELDWLKQNILSELESRTQKETADAQAGQEYVDNQLAEMTEEGLKFERNALLKFMVDFQKEYGSGSLLDEQGNYDFRKSLKLFTQLQPPEQTDNTVRRQVAAQASRNKVTTSSTSGIPIVSGRSLRRGNWRDAETGKFVSK